MIFAILIIIGALACSLACHLINQAKVRRMTAGELEIHSIQAVKRGWHPNIFSRELDRRETVCPAVKITG